MKRIIKPHITHQEIGGKEIEIDERITKELTNDAVFEMGLVKYNWACMNFINRRHDFNHNFPHKLYYGKVDGLGYVVAEDELEPDENYNSIQKQEGIDYNSMQRSIKDESND